MNQEYKDILALRPKEIKGEWTEQASRILHERYLLREDGQVIETEDERFWSVAYHLAHAERKWEPSTHALMALAVRFYKMMVNRDCLPNSPTIMNAGKNNGLQYSACYVLPINDSLGEIFDAI